VGVIRAYVSSLELPLPPPFLRSLRSRLLLLFVALAVGPLATVGLLDYARSRRMIRALIVAQTDTLARRAAATIADRYAVIRSDILLLSENAEVQQLFRELPRGDSSAIRGAQRAVDDYLQVVWRLAGPSYYTAELTDTGGVRLWYAGSDATSPDVADRLLTINEPVRDLESNRVVGALTLAPRSTPAHASYSARAVWSHPPPLPQPPRRHLRRGSRRRCRT